MKQRAPAVPNSNDKSIGYISSIAANERHRGKVLFVFFK